MEHYDLQQDEVVLYKGEVTRIADKRSVTELLLTNFYFVLIIKTKKLLAKERVEVEKYPIDSIKIYKDQPQVKQKDTTVDLYFQNAEWSLNFPSKKEAKTFVGKAFEIVLNKNAFVRGVAKAKAIVAMVDETLGIDSVGIAKTAVKVVAKKGTGLLSKQKGLQEATSVTSGLLGKGKKVTTKTLSPEEQAKAVEHFKKLFDDGAITQEEFDKKKREIIGL